MRSLVKNTQMTTSERNNMNVILSEIYNKLHKIEKLLREKNVDHNLKQYYVGQMSGLRMAVEIIKKETS